MGSNIYSYTPPIIKSHDYYDQYIEINDGNDWKITTKFLKKLGYKWYLDSKPTWPLNKNCQLPSIWISGNRSDKVIDYWHSFVPLKKDQITVKILINQGDIMSKQDIRDDKINKILNG